MNKLVQNIMHEQACMCYQQALKNDSKVCSLPQCKVTKQTQQVFESIEDFYP